MTEKEVDTMWDIRQEHLDLVESTTGSPKGKARPFDPERKVGLDSRDPRASPDQWPCFGEHNPGTPHANPHGQWIHCTVCNLRLSYMPRQGSHGQNTKMDAPAMTLRMLTEVKKLMNSAPPSAEICLAMQKKIDAEEVLTTLVKKKLLDHATQRDLDRKRYSPPQRKTGNSSSPESWDMVPSTAATPKKNHPESDLEKDLKAYLQDGEMKELMRLLEDRRSKTTSSASDSTPLQGLPTAYLEEDA